MSSTYLKGRNNKGARKAEEIMSLNEKGEWTKGQKGKYRNETSGTHKKREETQPRAHKKRKLLTIESGGGDPSAYNRRRRLARR